jgi:protein phosphatase
MPEPIETFFGVKTDPGQRANNEDYYVVVDVQARKMMIDALMIIADGMGGRNFGEAASLAAAETVEETLSVFLREGQKTLPDIEECLTNALKSANTKVQELSAESPDHEGMGTTCVIAVIQGNTLHVAHVGDSRAYMLRDQELIQITNDHSFVAEQVRAGAITKAGAKKSRLRNVITRAIGIEDELTPDYIQFNLDGVHAVLLCTDGLSNVVEDSDIAHLLAYADTAQDAADKLIQMANDNAGNDNITAVIARVRNAGPLAEAVETVVDAPSSEKRWADYDKKTIKIPHVSVLWLVVLVVIVVAIAVYFLNASHSLPTQVLPQGG